MLPRDKINSLVMRLADIDNRLMQPLDREARIKLSRERAEIEPVSVANGELLAAERERADLDALMGDPEMGEMAAIEAKQLDQKIADLNEKIRLLLIPKDAADEKSAILEIRAGTGGNEAALFAGDLFRMYQRYAANHGWKVELLSESEGEAGGYKEIVAKVEGRGVFAKLKFESGVHRVQRVPATEAQGRIHTSAATVAVLPEAEDVDIDLNPADLSVETLRASSKGGQHANTTDSAVRMTHVPTGISVTVSSRSQHQNRAQALEVMRSRLYELEREKVDSERSAGAQGADRHWRPFGAHPHLHFPQGRVTDHRINLTLYQLDKVLSGEALDELVDALTTDHQASLLAAEDA